MKQEARKTEAESPVKELVPMSPEAFRAVRVEKGWTPQLLSQRWGMTKRRVQQIEADADRPRYYDDALRGLPTLIPV
ncbi:hypothetical protein VQ574_20845 (plasmid) [Stutzerimonas frequens]|uniref:hypothetical protein n=1 Tax=Stutzerimonas frequens TaxID=2968969 RepID=UPI002DB759E7|nr:hypothetical protein [Stutzerimonas frequens]WRW29388.1 hypothetical protein VQ574_20845 [Stutzerimonas frequens]